MGTLRLHYEEKNILRPIGAFFLLKLKVTKIPIQNRAKIGPNRKIFSFPAIAVYVVKAVLDALGSILAGKHAHQVY